MLHSFYIILGTILVLSALLAAIPQISYKIRRAQLQICFLRVPVRRVYLTQIMKISKHRVPMAEKWPNTLFPSKRILFIQINPKSPRWIMITPEQRYVFKARLKREVYYAKKAACQLPADAVEPSADDDNDE